MSDQTNPYAATGLSSEAINAEQAIVPAGQGLRFANLIIDAIAQYMIAFVFGFTVVVIGGESGAAFLENTPGLFIGIPILIVYYLAFEATTSRTLGKLVTGTSVVNEIGDTPSFGQIVGRTFARLIPFEAFSFLGKIPRGWHDSLPKTYVVKVR